LSEPNLGDLLEEMPASARRIVYGAVCTWWGGIADVGLKPFAGEAVKGNLPVCPHCGRPLFEMASLAEWDEGVRRYAEKSGDADYPAFVAWLRGRPCLSRARGGWDEMRRRFDAERAETRP